LFCVHILVVAKVDAALDALSVDDVTQAEGKIVFQFRAPLSADEQEETRGHVADFDNLLRRSCGLYVSLLLLEQDNSIALYIACMTLSSLMGLREQWRSKKLRETVGSVFTFLSGGTRQLRVKKLTWSLNDYERCLEFFTSVQGISVIHASTNDHSQLFDDWRYSLTRRL